MLLAHRLSECIFDAIAGGMLPFSPGAAERGFRADDEVWLQVRQGQLQLEACSASCKLRWCDTMRSICRNPGGPGVC